MRRRNCSWLTFRGHRACVRHIGASDWWAVARALHVHAGCRRQACDTHVAQTSDALRALLDDPNYTRRPYAANWARISPRSRRLLDKLRTGELHIAVFGRVSVGKSALGNALLGREAFTTGVLHGTTRTRDAQRWQEVAGQGLHLIDTPGINELSGEERERLAFDVAAISDLVIFVVDGDMTSAEIAALSTLSQDPAPAAAGAEQGRSLHRRRTRARCLRACANMRPASCTPKT